MTASSPSRCDSTAGLKPVGRVLAGAPKAVRTRVSNSRNGSAHEGADQVTVAAAHGCLLLDRGRLLPPGVRLNLSRFDSIPLRVFA